MSTAPAPERAPVLEVRDLVVRFHTEAGVVHAVRGVSWDIDAGRSLALVGESGSGKTVSALALMGLVPSPPGRVEEGSVHLRGRSLLGLSPREWQRVRGREIAMVFQDPMTSLNPYMRVSDQMAEVLTLHKGMSKAEAVAESVR
ncbi:MAG: ABC transporter ATP-binding protein, partial [Gemmatimonadetes bacterium]|nr:ABC transporter ATP-binding protein [Gemmatimonadota bacterium]